MNEQNRLVLIGNGFDLAHGLKTSYRNFVDWYMCLCFKEFTENGCYSDELIEIKKKYAGYITRYRDQPTTLEEVLDLVNRNEYQSITFYSKFFKQLIELFKNGTWVNIECQYFHRLKNVFDNSGLTLDQKKNNIVSLNRQFDYLIKRLSEYFVYVNQEIPKCKKLPIENSRLKLIKAFRADDNSPVTFLNFNYTQTLSALEYAHDHEILHIHGSVADADENPIIFGYGDETDSSYQRIEDSGENVFLEHIKSFGYFKTDNYGKLISLIDSAPYTVYIVGHSCGLSDRILLSEIFEHSNCTKIEIFYHRREDGSDNFMEITQEISRHFKPHNKNLMRKRVCSKDSKNIIPQNKLVKEAEYK